MTTNIQDASIVVLKQEPIVCKNSFHKYWLNYLPQTIKMFHSFDTNFESSFSLDYLDKSRSYTIEAFIKTLQDEKNKENRKLLIEQLVNELITELNLFTLDSDEYSSAEKKIIHIANNYSFDILGDVIQSIYITNFNKSNYLCGICRALMRYDLEELNPWGVVIIPGLLNHKDETVKEYAVALIDNWNSTLLLPVLKNLDIKQDWLKDYINTVVERLENR